MKKLFLISLILISISVVNAQPDYNNFNRYFGIQVNTGITFFDLNNLKNGFSSALIQIRNQYYIPLEAQHLYPANICWSAYFFYYITPSTSLILGPEYTSTKAVSGYEDYAGTLDLKSELEEIYLSLGLKEHFNSVKFVQPLLGIKFGLTHFKYSEETSLNINDYDIHQDDKYETTDVGYIVEVEGGFTRDLNFVVLEVVLAYRYVHLETMEINPDNFTIRLGIKKGIFK